MAGATPSAVAIDAGPACRLPFPGDPCMTLSDLRPAGQEQGELDLFASDEVSQKPPNGRDRLMVAMDALNNRYGRDSIRLGSTAVGSNGADVAVWATRQERRSPRYTTRWDEMPVVSAR